MRSTKHEPPMASAIKVPEGKPAFEWILGRAVQKASPRGEHAVVQLALGGPFLHWARGRGRAGSEWRVWIAPPGEPERPLVPDIAFISFERMRGHAPEEWSEPHVAPDIVVEILSSSDRAIRVAHKRQVYLAAGTLLVIEIDPIARRLEAFDADGSHIVSRGPVFAPARFPDLQLPISDIFAQLDSTAASASPDS